MAKSIIGVGSPLLDILSGVEDSFLAGIGGEKGGMVNCEADEQDILIASLPGYRTAPGGAAGNTVFGLARLGHRAAMLGKTGSDAQGDFYRERFRACGGDVSAFSIDAETPTGRCVSLVTPDRERTMRTYLGAAVKLTAEDARRVDFSLYDVVYIEGYMFFNQPLIVAVLESAKAAGCEIAVDLASFEVVNIFREQLNRCVDEYFDMVFANEDEATALLGSLPEEEMARSLSRRCRIAAVKVGRRGAYVGVGGEVVKIEPDLADDAVDTTGAGDLWATGFLHGYLQGRPIGECGRFASITAREVVRIMGADIPEERWEVIRREFGMLN